MIAPLAHVSALPEGCNVHANSRSVEVNGLSVSWDGPVVLAHGSQTYIVLYNRLNAT
jgi:hypothetical protein